MNILIGDIGNTISKICLVDAKSFRIKKIIYIDSKNILKKNIFRRSIKNLINNKKISKKALFSSVVPKYNPMFKKFLKKKL